MATAADKFNALVLDFDGTLFPKRFVFAKPTSDPVLVNIVNILCTQYNFRIVISSLMSEQGIDKCKETLIEAGINPDLLMPVNWTTLSVGITTGDRPRQVAQWYKQHKHEIGDIVIFDDIRCSMVSPVHDFWYECDADSGITWYSLHRLCAEYDIIKTKDC